MGKQSLTDLKESHSSRKTRKESSVYSKLNVRAQWVSPSLISPSYTHCTHNCRFGNVYEADSAPIFTVLMGQTTKVLWKNKYLFNMKLNISSAYVSYKYHNIMT